MKKASVMAIAALLVVALIITSPQNCEGSLIGDFILSAEKATSFFPGAEAQGATTAEAADEAAELAAKTPAEINREQSKSPDEVAREVAEDASDEL